MIAARKEGALLCSKRTKVGLVGFWAVKVTGKSVSGGVCVMQKVDTGKIYAAKTLKREEMLRKDQVGSLCSLFTLYVMR